MSTEKYLARKRRKEFALKKDTVGHEGSTHPGACIQTDTSGNLLRSQAQKQEVTGARGQALLPATGTSRFHTLFLV